MGALAQAVPTRIAADGNQQWSTKTAIAWARAMEDVQLAWLEEPVPAADLSAHAQVRQAIAMDLATGETLFGVGEAHRALRAGELAEAGTAPAQDEEFVLSHSDSVEASGFVQHLKLPHYVDFQSELVVVRALRAELERRNAQAQLDQAAE